VRAIAEEARRYVGQTIVTTDGYQVSEEGCHGSMIIQQGGIPHTNNSGMDIITVCLTKREAGGFEMMGHICYIYVDTKLDDNIYTNIIHHYHARKIHSNEYHIPHNIC
jgi:hypothetical protein